MSVKPTVAEFLTQVEITEPDKYEIVKALRDLSFVLHPDLSERMMYGGILFDLAGADVGGIFIYANHVSYEFGHGKGFHDPDHLLEGKGKFRRHLKLQDVSDIESKTAAFFIAQMADGNR